VHVLTNTVTSGPAERAAYEAQSGELEREVHLLVDQLVDLQRRFGDQVDIDRFEGFRRAWNDYLRARDEQLLPLSREGRGVEALAVAQEDGRVDLAYERIITQLTTLQSQIEDESDDRLELAEHQFALNRDLLVLALLLAGGVGIVLGALAGLASHQSTTRKYGARDSDCTSASAWCT
jgi:hypothetical protein